MQLENKSIGGYFELELPEGKGHYYPEALKYQSARAAFYDLLLHVKPNKVWMPYYICGSMLEPLEKANIETGFYSINLDFIFSDNGDFYFLELGPRNGGCLIPEVIRYSTEVDLIKYTVDAALGLDCSNLIMAETNGYWSSYMVHALEDGQFKDLWLSDRAKKYIVEQDIQVKSGDKVRKFSGSHDTLGTMILKYPSLEVMLEMVDNMENDIRVINA